MAIVEAKKLGLTVNYFYFALLGELYIDINKKESKLNFQKAFSLIKTNTIKQTIQKKLNSLK